ncbi:MAG: hypothetical protein AAB664_03100 [Patescibacteria group bacterium]
MNDRSSQQLEDLFERAGTLTISEDTEHRYALRRKILCYKFFEKQNAHHSRRSLLVFVPFFASGIIVTILFISSSTPSQTGGKISQAPASQIKSVDKTPLPTAFTNSLVAKYIDDRPLVPATILVSPRSNRVVVHTASALYAQ